MNSLHTTRALLFAGLLSGLSCSDGDGNSEPKEPAQPTVAAPALPDDAEFAKKVDEAVATWTEQEPDFVEGFCTSKPKGVVRKAVFRDVEHDVRYGIHFRAQYVEVLQACVRKLMDRSTRTPESFVVWLNEQAHSGGESKDEKRIRDIYAALLDGVHLAIRAIRQQGSAHQVPSAWDQVTKPDPGTDEGRANLNILAGLEGSFKARIVANRN